MTLDLPGPGDSKGDNRERPPDVAKAGGTGLDPSDATALSSKAISDLRRSALDGNIAISDHDRVYAVRLLGQFRDDAATDALVSVLTEAGQRLHPPPLGRWVRDTALDTLLRSPMQSRSTVNKRLGRYYSFLAGPLRGIRRRSLVYDDIPALARHGRLGLLLRVYVLPLVLALFALILLSDAVFDRLRPGDNLTIYLLGAVFLISLGLLTLNVHQILLVSLRALFRKSPTTGRPKRRRSKLFASFVLFVVGAALSIFTVLYVLRQAVGTNSRSLTEIVALVLALPVLLLGSYILAYDLEVAHDIYRGTRWVAACAVGLRLLSGVMYIAYVTVALGVSFYVGVLTGRNAPTAVWLVRALFAAYLVAAPLLLLLLAAGVGGARRLVGRLLQGRAVRAGGVRS
ncbi:MAG TPA: hypothetical protein VGE04_15160 [Chloroflexia bacterium]|jgi:hypothetical protein